MESQGRVIIDCRTFPGSKCSVTIAGTEEEVLALAVTHAVAAHGEKETPELRAQLRSMLKEEALR